jgi:lipoprotein NlpD
LLCACADSAPQRLQSYVVRSNDTLYSIAWRHNLDFRDLARWNHIGADYRISVGQVLVLGPAGESTSQRVAPRAAPRPAPAPAAAGSPNPSLRSTPAPQVSKPRPLPESAGTTSSTAPNTAGAPNHTGAPNTAGAPNPTGAPSSRSTPAAAGANGSLRWVWPTDRIGAPRSVPGGGVLLSGRLGQDVRAASAGRVVYAGNGLRGYGNLIIIKHAESVLSAYAHNREILVHDGQEVAIGQVIAHMGEGPQQSPILYFEIRQNGKPVDPMPYLPKAR